MSLANEVWHRAMMREEVTIEAAIKNLDEVSIKIVLVVADSGVLVGTLSDGDIRRGLLQGLTLGSKIASIIQRNPLVVPLGMSRDYVMRLMLANKILQIPIVNEVHHLVGLHIWDELSVPAVKDNLMVIMAGGLGKRLSPLTDTCPKPLLPLAGRPMLEHIIERAKAEGFNRFLLAIHYLGEMIQEYFGDGSRVGVEIKYLKEKSPLGTAGALSLLGDIPHCPFVVTNGDVITDIKYSELLDFHVKHHSDATMAVRGHEWQNPFGVVQIDGSRIIGFEEKPIIRSYINAGVYALNPTVLSSIESGKYCDMPTLFERLRLMRKSIVAYPMHEPWLDVGRPEDLKIAENKVI